MLSCVHCSRSIKILAESYAIKGLCLEQQSTKPTSKFKKAEKDTEMVCAEIGLSYDAVKTFCSSRSSASNAPPIWVCCICRNTILPAAVATPRTTPPLAPR